MRSNEIEFDFEIKGYNNFLKSYNVAVSEIFYCNSIKFNLKVVSNVEKEGKKYMNIYLCILIK